METDWESMYRSWKEGYGWRNRRVMFLRCEVWLGDMQEVNWIDKEWGRVANYVINGPSSRREENGGVVNIQQQAAVAAVVPPVGHMNNQDGQIGGVVGGEDEEMMEVAVDNGTSGGDLEQFQWP